MDVRPHEGFGPIDFGATLEQVIEIMGPPDRGPFYGGLYQYVGLLMNVSFDKSGMCIWIACDPERCRPTVYGIPLVGRLDDIAEKLGAQGYDVRMGKGSDQGSAYCDALGILLGRDDPDEEEIDTVAAWPPGHHPDPVDPS